MNHETFQVGKEIRDGQQRAAARLTRILGFLIVVVDLLVLSSCPAAGILPESTYLSSIDTTAPSIASVPDGTYAGSAAVGVPLGSIAAAPFASVEVTIVNHAYTAIKMTAPKNFPGGVSRFDALAARVVATQGTDVDAVSGATFTSKAFLKAVAKAVTQ